MQAYLNNPELKQVTVNAMAADIEAERLVKGHYWDNDQGNGCFVGCVIRGSAHADFEIKLGIPKVLARLADRAFESLTYSDAKQFSMDFLKAIKPGADLSKVFDKLTLFFLTDTNDGVLKLAKTDGVKQYILDVAEFCKRKIAGDVISAAEWQKLRARGYSAGAYASADAYAYASADAYAYAYASADAYAYAYASADASADAYAYAYASADAKAKRRKIFADKLISLLSEEVVESNNENRA